MAHLDQADDDGGAIVTQGVKDEQEAAGIRVHRFAILSGIGWLLDFTIFNLLAWFGLNLFVANLIGAITGVSWVFVTARAFIFRSRVVPFHHAVLGYVAWNAVAIFVASVLVDVIGTTLEGLARGHGLALAGIPLWRLAAPAAKIAVTPFTMYGNYVAMGYIVERRLSWR